MRVISWWLQAECVLDVGPLCYTCVEPRLNQLKSWSKRRPDVDVDCEADTGAMLEGACLHTTGCIQSQEEIQANNMTVSQQGSKLRMCTNIYCLAHYIEWHMSTSEGSQQDQITVNTSFHYYFAALWTQCMRQSMHTCVLNCPDVPILCECVVLMLLQGRLRWHYSNPPAGFQSFTKHLMSQTQRLAFIFVLDPCRGQYLKQFLNLWNLVEQGNL